MMIERLIPAVFKVMFGEPMAESQDKNYSQRISNQKQFCGIN